MSCRFLPAVLGQMMYVAALAIGLAGVCMVAPVTAQEAPLRIVAFGLQGMDVGGHVKPGLSRL